MLKFMYFSFMVSLIFDCLMLHCVSFKCAHDQIIEKHPTFLKRSVKYKEVLKQREKNPKSFEPLKVYFLMENFHATLSLNVIHNLELAVRKVRTYIEETFKVYKRKKPFVLGRQSCTRKWQAGPNKGKCSKLTNEPENCVTQDIVYPIPPRFLDKLELYDYDVDKPRYELPPGSGLHSSNFIIFVISEYSSICDGSDISAIGTYCRLDKETNEPLAGIINLCPNYFSRKLYPANHYYNILLHEMFHILGFSIHLFEKFFPCRKGAYCDIPKNIIQMDSYDIPRLMFPLVIEHMQKHFSCSDSDFGGPMVLEVTNSTEEEEDETKQYTSHWDPILMYSSIMMPKFSEYDNLFVDNVTLSVFDSTGWYIVNYSKADDFRFGKDQGCKFGINATCDDNAFLCDPKAENKLGCDVTQQSIGQCTELSPYHKCGVYQPYSQDNCETKLGKEYSLDFSAMGYQYKCFMMSEGHNATASCLPVKCKTSNTYSILINMTWYECFSLEKINIDTFSILCPESSLFCTDAMLKKIVRRKHCPADKNFFIAVRMYFSHPKYDELYKSHGFKNFKVTTLRGIADEIGIPVNYIVNSSLSVFGNIQLDFIICPTLLKGSNELTEIIFKVQSFLDREDFMKTLGSDMIVTSKTIKMDPLDTISFSDHEGFRTLLIFPALCAIFLVATFVASIMRWLVRRRRKQ